MRSPQLYYDVDNGMTLNVNKALFQLRSRPPHPQSTIICLMEQQLEYEDQLSRTIEGNNSPIKQYRPVSIFTENERTGIVL